jgi:PST family polysaccharide transporter
MPSDAPDPVSLLTATGAPGPATATGAPDPAAAGGAPGPATATPTTLAVTGPDVVAAAPCGRSIVQGVVWTAAAKWSAQLVTWVSTVLIARTLTPADYGVVAMAVVFTDLVASMCELGIGQGVLVFRDLREADLRQLNSLSVLLGLTGALITVLVGATLAVPMFGNPQLPGVFYALSPVFLVSAFKTVPAALLQRDLRFRRIAAYDALQAIVLAGSTLGLALAGAGYWALVVSILLGTTLSTIGVVSARPVGFALPRFATLAPVLRLSRNVLASRLMWYTYSRADTFIVGRALGSVALGNYSIAWTIGNVPVDKAGAVLSQVTPSVFAAVAKDRKALGRYFLSFTEGTALLLAPPCIGLAITAADFVPVVLGARWMPMAAPLAAIAVFAAIKAAIPLVSQLLIASGHSGKDTLYNMILLLVFPPAVWVAARFGLVYVALAWLVVLPGVYAWQIGMALKVLGLRPRDYLAAIAPAFQACLLVAATAAAARLLVPEYGGPRARRAAAAAAGAIAYTLFVIGRHGDRLRTFRDLARARS